MKNNYIVIILVLLMFSCKLIYHKAPRYLKTKGYTFRYTGVPSRLAGKINTNGYFTLNDTLNSGHKFPHDNNVMFFDDGMFAEGFFYCCDTILSHVGKFIPQYIDTIVMRRKQGHRNSSFYHSIAWGYYKVLGDTIKVQLIDRPMLGSSSAFWGAYESWFIIIDEHTISKIYSYPIHKLSEDQRANLRGPDGAKRYYFKSLPERPESDGWLKYEKWFWEDQSKYVDWINQGLMESNLK